MLYPQVTSLVAGIFNKFVSAERVLCVVYFLSSKSFRYLGPIPLCSFQARTSILKSILALIGSQCDLQTDSDLQTVLDPSTSTRFSFAHINVNGIDVDGRIDELRYLFQNKPFDVIGINETN